MRTILGYFLVDLASIWLLKVIIFTTPLYILMMVTRVRDLLFRQAVGWRNLGAGAVSVSWGVVYFAGGGCWRVAGDVAAFYIGAPDCVRVCGKGVGADD